MARLSILGLVSAALVAGCSAKKRQRTKEPIDELLSLADEQWRDRGQVGLDQLDAALIDADSRRPGDREVLWRLARVEVARGLAATEERSRVVHFGQAREFGLRCLDRHGGFRQQRRLGEWTTGLDLLPAAFAPCAGWASVAWARWVTMVGPEAVALDRQGAVALGEWASGAARPDVAGLGAWALATLGSASLDWVERGQVLGHYATARRAGVGGLWLEADQLVWVARPSGDQEMIERLEARLRDTRADVPEDAAARRVID